jgi:hypothetical protein
MALHMTLVVDQGVRTNLRSLLHDRGRHHKSVILDLEARREQFNRNPGGKDCPKAHAQQSVAEPCLISSRLVKIFSAHLVCSLWADSANRRENVSGKNNAALFEVATAAIQIAVGDIGLRRTKESHADQAILLSSHSTQEFKCPALIDLVLFAHVGFLLQ